jgi:hypothetical protein
MNLTFLQYQEIYKLYPQVVRIDVDVAYDAESNVFQYDLNAVNISLQKNSYIAKRQAEYPSFTDYIDGVVKGDQAQIDKYIADCQAVKAKYPK